MAWAVWTTASDGASLQGEFLGHGPQAIAAVVWRSMAGSKIRVAVLFGGQSSEHPISCVSAGSVLKAIDRGQYEVTAIGIARDGRWVAQLDSAEQLAITDGRLPEVDDSGSAIAPTRESLSNVDVVFPVLHGPFGEDGTVQGLLELAGIPYVGSGVLASAAAMDKAHFKLVMQASGLPTVKSVLITDLQWRTQRERIMEEVATLGLPLFVKPSRAGSSVGISKVHRYSELMNAIEQARQHDPRVVVEQGHDGVREIEVGVMTDTEGLPIASVCGEVVVRSGHEFYDFHAKYLDDAADLYAPANLDDALAQEIRDLACKAFLAIGAEGLARVDFFITAKGQILINEINTMPGFTSISMFPRMWQATGFTYPQIIDHLIKDALRRGTGLR